MRKSKLEVYQEILGVLKDKPMTVDLLSYRTGMDVAGLRQRLNFLVKNNLVSERMSSEMALFAVSDRGLAVLRALDIERRLEKVRTSMMTLDAVEAKLAAPKQRGKAEY
jgi:predicted transcriptional regulator